MEKCFPTLQIRTLVLRFLLLAFTLTHPDKVYAWGARAHFLVCEAAIDLIKDKLLKQYLISKVQAMTYLCNTPDIYWKSIKGTDSGYPTHFFEPDVVGLSFESMPLQLAEVEKLVAGKTNLQTGREVFSSAVELGTSWWRADQFARLSLDAGKRATKTVVPNKEDEDTYQMWIMMGLLGHFVADNAQPLHTTSNYDGWQTDHGGIHSFYESDLVNELPYNILTDIIKDAPKASKELQLAQKGSVLETMKQLSILSHKDLTIIFSLDPIIKKSTLVREKGMEIKAAAERKPASEAVKKFKPLLVKHMSRAATLIAYLWEKIYIDAGKPPVYKDRSYRFPHQIEFIAPDYAENK